MRKLAPIILVLVTACGATQTQIDALLKATETQARIYASDSTTAVNLVEWVIANGNIDTNTDNGRAVMARLVQTRDQLKQNQNNYRIVGYKLQEAVMALKQIPAAERAQYVSDLATILGSLGGGQ